MDIEKILVLIRLCTKKILNDLLKSQDTMMFSYAFEFQLILVGERINSVIDEIEIFLFKNTQLFINLLNQATVQFDEARILNVKEEDYKRRLFRQTFNKTNIGSGLMLLNTLRNNLKHRFHILDEDSHGKFKVFYHQVHKIQIFLTKIMNFFGKEMSSEEIILNLFKATNIETLAFAEIKAVATLFEVKAKSQTSTLAFAQQKVKVSKHLNRLYAYKHMLEKYEVELIKENQNKDQNKNRTPLYATAMCLIAIGEIATGLIMIRKDEKKFDVSIKDVLSKHSKLLGNLSGISTYLTHETQSLPTFPSLVKVCKNVLQDVSSLENLLEVINSLNQTILPEQQVHRLGEPFEQEHEELAKESPNVVRSTTIAPSSSLIISSSQQNKKDQSEKNVKRKEPATPSSEEDDPNAKRPKFSI